MIEKTLHLRQMNMKAVYVSEDRFRVIGHLQDERDYPSPTPMGNIVAPGIAHDMVIDVEVSLPDLTIVKITAEMSRTPLEGCDEAAEWIKSLEGLTVGAGITRAIGKRFGGPRGCAHLNSLVLAMTQVIILGAQAHQQLSGEGARSGDVVDGVLNSCHMWKEDGEMARRQRAMTGAAPTDRAEG